MSKVNIKNLIKQKEKELEEIIEQHIKYYEKELLYWGVGGVISSPPEKIKKLTYELQILSQLV